MAGTLTVEWIDPTGEIWDLTGGTQGVILDVNQADLTLSPIKHSYVRSGTQWAGMQVQRAEPSLRIWITKQGMEYYALADRWWSVANSPVTPGVLRVTRPDGMVRELRARLRDSPGTTYRYDPGAGFDETPVEAWLLTSESAYWSGPEQVTRFTQSAVSSGAQPFYGTRGYGWPLYIAGAATAQNLFLTNPGQGPMWLTWTLVGPMTAARFGVEGAVLAYDGAIPSGETVVVSTEPGNRYAVETTSGENRYGRVSGVYAPAPVGAQVPLTITAEGMNAQSAVMVTGRAQYARPF